MQLLFCLGLFFLTADAVMGSVSLPVSYRPGLQLRKETCLEMDYKGKATVRLQWNTFPDPKLRVRVKQWQVQLSQSPSFGTVELDSTVEGSNYTYTAKFSLRKRTRSPLICAPLFVRVRAIGKSGAKSAWSSVAALAIRGLFTGNFISNIATTQYRSGALRFAIGYCIIYISSMCSLCLLNCEMASPGWTQLERATVKRIRLG